MITNPPSTTSDLASTLRTDTEAICLPNGRKVGSAGHEKAGDYLANRLNEIGCVPHAGDSFKLPYEYGGTSFCNIVGVDRKQTRGKGPGAEATPLGERVLIGDGFGG